MKALEYKADFTLIKQIVKSLEDTPVFPRKYMIHCFIDSLACVVLKAFDPPLKKVFCKDYNGAFRFKGGGGGGVR
jgi:hypothetical protein